MIDRNVAPDSVLFLPFEIKQAQPTFLQNGLPVFYLQSGSQKILRLELVFNAGSWHEKSSGVSYLASKMLVEGSIKYSSKEIAEYIATYGAFMEIHPGFENVNYTFYLMEKHMENLLPLISEIIKNANFPIEELYNLKNITIQSLRVNKEKNQFLASLEFRKALFTDSHPYGKQYWEDDIESVSQNQIFEFAKQFFTLDRLEIFVSGQFDIETTSECLNRYFGQQELKSCFNTNIISKKNTIVDKEVFITKSGSVQSSIRIGCQSISRSNPDFIPLTVTNEILGGYFGSRLMRNIREDKGFTYGIHSSIHTLKNGAYFVIATDVKIENTRQTLNEISSEILKLQSENISEEELDTVKSYMLGRFMNSINSPFSLMDKFKTLHYSGLDYDFYGNYVNAIQNVSAKDIQIQAVKYLNYQELVKIVIGGIDN